MNNHTNALLTCGRTVRRPGVLPVFMGLALGLVTVAAQARFLDERKPESSPTESTAPVPLETTPTVKGPAEVAAPSAPAMIPAGDSRPYQLTAGRPIHTQLMDWAKSSGWVLKWSPANTWEVFADTTIVAKSTDEAVEQVVQNLHMEGKPVRLRVYVGNRVMEVEALSIGE
jgi:Toxin co-regulated pilus biosynthesis protein Q